MWESQRNGLAVALESLDARDPNSLRKALSVALECEIVLSG